MDDIYLYNGAEFTYEDVYKKAIEGGYDSAEAYLAQHPDIVKKEIRKPETNLQVEDEKALEKIEPEVITLESIDTEYKENLTELNKVYNTEKDLLQEITNKTTKDLKNKQLDEKLKQDKQNLLYKRNEQQILLDSKNTRVDNVGIHDWMLAGENQNVKVNDQVWEQTPSELTKTLKEAYPDYDITTTYKTTNPFLQAIGLGESAAETFDYYKDVETGIKMTDKKTGESLIIPNYKFAKDDKTRNDLIQQGKQKIIEFVDDHGIDAKAYSKKYEEDKKKLDKINEITSISAEEEEEIDNKLKNPDLFKPYTKTTTIAGGGMAGMAYVGGNTQYVSQEIFPYAEELAKAKTLMSESVARQNQLRSPDDQLPAPTNKEIENFARRLIKNQEVVEIEDTKWTTYLEENEDEMQAVLKYYKRVDQDRSFKLAAGLQTLQEAAIQEYESPATEGSRIIVENFEEIYLDPSKQFILEENQQDIIVLENGKQINKSKFDEYISAKDNLKVQYTQLKDRQARINKETDNIKDIDAQFDLLRRDYDTWSKFLYNAGSGFASIGAGIGYGIGKTVQGLTYYMEDYDGPRTKSKAVGDFLDQQALNFTEWKEESREQYAKDVKFEDAFTSGPAAFGRFITQEVGHQLPILTTIIASGGTASPYVIGAYAAGEKYMNMDAEDIRSGEERNEITKFGVSIGYGLSEAVFERLTTIEILKRGQDYLRTAKASGGRSLFKEYSDAMRFTFQNEWKRVFIQAPGMEAGGESLTQMSQNLLDGRPLLENVGHAAFSGGMFGWGMSVAPVMYGMAMTKFQDPKLYEEYNNTIKDISKINAKLKYETLTDDTKTILEEQRNELQKAADENLMEITNLTLTSMSPKSFLKFNENTAEQELLRNKAEKIINNKQLSKKERQEALQKLNKKFTQLQYGRDLFRNHKAFGNQFALLKNGNIEDQKRYAEIEQQAIENIRSRKNESIDFIPDEKQVMDEAYDLFMQDQILSRVEQANNSEAVGIEVVETNEQAIQIVNESNLSESDKQNLIDNIKAGNTNGVDAAVNGKPLVFLENAIKNERSSTTVHEPGHEVFRKILQTNAGAFENLQAEVSHWLKKNDPELLSIIESKQTQSDNKNLSAEEFIMEFLEQVDQENINFENVQGKNLATLFGFSSATAMEAKGFELDLKGQKDAVSFLVGLAAKIRTGTLTEQDIVDARDSKALSSTVAASLVSDVFDGAKESRELTQEERNEKYQNIFEEELKDLSREEYLNYMLEDGVPLNKGGKLTPQGQNLYRNLVGDFAEQILQVSKMDPEVAQATAVGPFLQHLLALNPETQLTAKNPISAYMGNFLPLKVGTAKKQTEKGKTKGKTVEIDAQVEGRRTFDPVAQESGPKQVAKENLREQLKIEKGGKFYNNILRKVKLVVPTLTSKTGLLTQKKTGVTLKQALSELSKDPFNSNAIQTINSIYKSFRQELRKAFDTVLFKDVKNSMGIGKAYDDYLKTNRLAIMSLPITDLVQMQKRADEKILVEVVKKNLSPNEIRANEGDVVYTDPKSGPTLYKRLKPDSKEFVDFFKVRGRKDALAKNISARLGELATVQTLDTKDNTEIFLSKNPTLQQVPTDMLLNSISQAIDVGRTAKLSNESQRNVFKQYGTEFVNNLKQQNLGTTNRAIRAALYKTFINENPTKVWGETLEDQQKTLNKFAGELKTPITKYLKPEGKTSLKKLGAVVDVGDFTIEEINQKELSENLQKLLNLDTKLAEAFEDPANITFQRDLEAAFVEDLAKRKGKVEAVRIALTILKGHNATSGKIGATSLGARPADPGVKPQPRYQVFESMKDFVNAVVNTLPGVDVVMGKTKDGKTTIESITIDEKSIDKYPSREAQKSKTKEHFEETFEKRKVEAQEAWDTMMDYLDFVYKNGNNLSFAMNMMSLKSNMDSMLKASALAKYYYVGPSMKAIDLRYEHMIPTESVVINLTKHFLGNKIDLQALKDKYNVAIIPKQMDDNINVQFQKSMPSNWTTDMSETKRYYGDLMLGYNNMYALEIIGGPNKGDIIGEEYLKLNESVIKAKQSNESELSNNVVKFSEELSNEDVINYAATIDEALSRARDPKAPVKKIRVFDFDDTLATSKNIVKAVKDGKEIELNAEEFATRGLQLIEEGYTMDFSDFNKVTDGSRGPLFEVAQQIKKARGNEDLYVLTARAPESQQAIYDFLKAEGLEFKKKNIIGLGNSTGAAKAKWIVEQAAKGYNDFYFADDAFQNVKAVRDALNVIDVKSKVQQAKVKFSEDVDADFNRILEDNFNIGREKEYSAAKAKTLGANKGNFKFWIPYSAEDITGLIYKMLGKGKQGDAQMAWFKNNLLQPYSRAMNSLSTARVNLLDDFRALKKQLNVPKDLKKTNKSGFSNEQAVRIYIWNKMGYDIPGLSKRDSKELIGIVNNNENLSLFADELMRLTKNVVYTKPGESWLAGTITTDLLDTINTELRSKLLEQSGFTANADLIFSEKNLNKLEVIYGPKYVEALKKFFT